MVSSSKLLLLKTKSINDLCRRACGTDKGNVIFMYRKQGKNLLVVLGEKLDDTVLAYYFPIEGEVKKYLFYSIDPVKHEESVVSLDRVDDASAMASDTRCSLAIVEADFSKLESKTKKAEVPSVVVGSILDMAKLFVKKAVQEEVLPIAYVFKEGNKNIFGTFDLLGELQNDLSTFYYTFAEDDGKSAFLKYDYKEDTVSLTNNVDSHAFFYVRLVRLAEKFPITLKKL